MAELGAASAVIGIATAPITVVDAVIRLRRHVQRIRQNPEHKDRLLELANKHLAKLKDLEAYPDDGAFSLIKEDLLSVRKELNSLSRGIYSWFSASHDSEQLTEAERRLDTLLGNVIQLCDRVRIRNQEAELPPCKIGINRFLPALDFLVHNEEQPLRVIGISGQGGFGKTTILNAIWNYAALVEPFQCRAYVQVGEEATPETIAKVQSRIYSQLSGRVPNEFASSAHGRRELSQLFKSLQTQKKPIFLAIDNIFKDDHLMELLPSELAAEIMPSSSCIAVTSRDFRVVKAILRICNLEAEISSQVYFLEPECLSFEDSKILFAESAKMSPSDAENQGLLAGMVPLCGGVPYALELLGRIFVDKEKRTLENWRAIQRQCTTLDDPDNVNTKKLGKKILGLSYETLESTRKKAFLDVVTSFYGWRWEVVESIIGKDVLADLKESSLIWEVSGIDKCNQSALSDGWDNTTNSIHDEAPRLSMHDITLRYGKKLDNEPGYVEHPRMNLGNIPDPASLKNLILYHPKDMNFSQQLAQELYVLLEKASGLQTLIVEEKETEHPTIKYRSAASIGGKQNLRYLTLSGKLAQQCYTILKQKEALRDIVYLALFHCDIEELGDIYMPLLQELYIVWCRARAVLVDEQKLCSLKVLFVADCERVIKLAESIGGLEYLEIISVERCKGLMELPGDIGKLRCLKKLYLNFCESVKQLPEGICGMESLEILDLRGCQSFVELPEDIGKLCCLKELILDDCNSLQMVPESICGMASLESIFLFFCEKLVALPGDIGQLRCVKLLYLCGCRSLQKLPESLCGMESLESLNVCLCNSLEELPAGLGKMPSLSTLSLSNFKMLEKCEGSMEFLESLEVWRCCNGGELSGGVAEKLSSLKEMSLWDCDSLMQMLADEVLSRMESLEVLEVMRCNDVELPAGVGKLRSLKTLSLSGFSMLKKLPESLGSMESLETLELGYCEALEELPEQLARLTSLQRLYIGSGCPNLKNLPDLSSSVRIDRCDY